MLLPPAFRELVDIQNRRFGFSWNIHTRASAEISDGKKVSPFQDTSFRNNFRQFTKIVNVGTIFSKAKTSLKR